MPDPVSFKEIISRNNWQQWLAAIKKEINKLKELEIWTLNTPLKGRKIIDGKKIYKIKLNLFGILKQYKARWMIKRFL